MWYKMSTPYFKWTVMYIELILYFRWWHHHIYPFWEFGKFCKMHHHIYRYIWWCTTVLFNWLMTKGRLCSLYRFISSKGSMSLIIDWIHWLFCGYGLRHNQDHIAVFESDIVWISVVTSISNAVRVLCTIIVKEKRHKGTTNEWWCFAAQCQSYCCLILVLLLFLISFIAAQYQSGCCSIYVL